MVYTLGNGVTGGNGNDGGGGEKKKGRGEVVVAVEGMGSGRLHPPGRFLELVVEPKRAGKGGRQSSTASTAKGKKKGGGNSSDTNAQAAADAQAANDHAAIFHAIRTQGTRKGHTEAIVAHPDLWRPMSDAAACEKVKQAFRNLSKGLISDPKVQSAFVVGNGGVVGVSGGGVGVSGGGVSGGGRSVSSGGGSKRSAAGSNSGGGRGRRRSSNER